MGGVRVMVFGGMSFGVKGFVWGMEVVWVMVFEVMEVYGERLCG